ncbi:fused MFS/spermidine synthase [Ochrobactrum vermis]|uniref:Fused MFS/spermidine synthase n=1 Tax=Ochrobactrum vermis TaxID=1827297 RepID=A0ABU8P944_9HYPH|nr:fused MFS/spermidine synthase [Ochrobactrum vermis]PQZ29324.1 spermidine synthase [Ochrobactrum vermis]
MVHSIFLKDAKISSNATRLWLAASLLLVSGFSSLIFQVVWIRQLSTIIGVDVYAVSAGISAFMGGLAVGSLIFGRLADHLQTPLLLYGGLEAMVAALGLLVTISLPHLAVPFAKLEDGSTILAWSLLLLTVTVPAVFMGGTLPAMLCSIKELGHPSAMAGRLYAANTMGAIAGTLAASFVLIPSLGLAGTAGGAAAGSFGTAITVFFIRGAAQEADGRHKVHSMLLSGEARQAIILYAVAGGVALGYEVVWTQSIVQFMSTRAFAFSVVLATYLAGLALGSAAISPFMSRVKRPWSVLGFLIGTAGVVAAVEIALLGRWIIVAQSFAEYWILAATENRLAGMSARFAVAAFTMVFTPTLLLGAAFPVVVMIVARTVPVGRAVGLVGGWNTLGGITGSFFTGFVLVPQFGFVRAIGILALIASLLATIALLRCERRSLQAMVASGLLVVIAGLCLAFVPANRFAQLLPGIQKGELVFYEEGLGATVAVVEQGNNSRFRRLYIQGVSNTGDSMASERYMRLQALLPLIIADTEPKSVLIIGFGTGITAGATLAFDSLDKRVVAELLPGVVRASRTFKGNYGAPDDPRIDLRLRDGRRELIASDSQYDLITLEPPPPSAAGVANLYSTDFYRLASKRLTGGGIVAQWLPLPTQNVEDTRALIKSFTEVFPFVHLWTTELHEMMMTGSMRPMPLDYGRMTARFEQPMVRKALQDVGIQSVDTLLATWVTDRNGLMAFAGDVQSITDNNPSIEYGTWVRPHTFQTTLTSIMHHAGEPEIVNLPPHALARVQRDRQYLYTFYQAGLASYNNDREAWQENGAFVMQYAGANPYYRWFFTAGSP